MKYLRGVNTYGDPVYYDSDNKCFGVIGVDIDSSLLFGNEDNIRNTKVSLKGFTYHLLKNDYLSCVFMTDNSCEAEIDNGLKELNRQDIKNKLLGLESVYSKIIGGKKILEHIFKRSKFYYSCMIDSCTFDSLGVQDVEFYIVTKSLVYNEPYSKQIRKYLPVLKEKGKDAFLGCLLASRDKFGFETIKNWLYTEAGAILYVNDIKLSNDKKKLTFLVSDRSFNILYNLDTEELKKI